MGKTALIVQGGWEGHQPREVSEVLAQLLKSADFAVEVADNLEVFSDAAHLKTYNLIVPHWTMGTISHPQLEGLVKAVQSGVGITGLHGGMGDAFRDAPEFQYMVGGQWVAHPGNDGVTYDVNITDKEHEITAGIHDFTVTSEQYYMHVDPVNHVLATTQFGEVTMPVAWTKTYGQGRVFYCSLGHTDKVVKMPEVSQLMLQGMVWAAAKD
ncbi:ThuA domain-containing protein [Alicyclobacillus fodiniaquatilis]|uniref:ThuA domain-containing protein n=1 Tax=Alicyclobacillus fodiniaquatilis TaxID=1661150 RepID=A0ABW4JIN8_9BACL